MFEIGVEKGVIILGVLDNSGSEKDKSFGRVVNALGF